MLILVKITHFYEVTYNKCQIYVTFIGGIHFQDFIFLDKGGFIMMNHQNMDTISNTTSSSNEDNSTKDHIHTENVVQLVISLYVPLFL